MATEPVSLVPDGKRTFILSSIFATQQCPRGHRRKDEVPWGFELITYGTDTSHFPYKLVSLTLKIRDAGSGVLPVGGEVLAALALAVGAATQPLGLDAAAGVAEVGLTFWNKKTGYVDFSVAQWLDLCPEDESQEFEPM